MSMIGNLLRVSQADLARYQADSQLFEDRIYKEYDDTDEAMVDLDKSWHVLAFLLGETKDEFEDHPMAGLIFGKHTLDENQDVGYGPARYLTADEVKELNQTLTQLTNEEIKKRFSPALCEEHDIYPSFWAGEDAEDLWEYIHDNLQVLRTAYQKAADQDEAMITYLN
ncbi:YfbM family protein [Myroides sp. 1354]|uniref:YfbM family protein n=1 Tax=unclassified Myroides TaxID=2642485 RepID=UPI002577B2CB|nr:MULTISPECIES: YfbM family protein [unclassified Myroides]MDM1044121.1 YfbM family protein [Myroides sp. R163-1]MDM1055056.1 YfbM family protein [Myroides sp. 1354]MDM1068353.1 YfbM family protein [Myroides sp. 1372]